MNRLKKYLISFAICAIGTSSLIGGNAACAASLPIVPSINIENQSILNNWISMPLRENVSKDKVWNINLKNSIPKTDVSDSSIFVLDENQKKVSTTLALSADGKQVKVTPTNSYAPGHSYMLYIIGSANGTCMPFTINSDFIQVDQNSNNQSITLAKGSTLQLTLPNVGADGGYSWDLQSFDKSLLEGTSNFNIITSFNPARCPSTSLNTRWLFKANNVGATSIELQYKRTLGETSTINTFKLNVNVK